MTDDQIREMARKYAAEVYNGDTDFIDEAENVISWLLRDYYIVNKNVLQKLQKCPDRLEENSDFGLRILIKLFSIASMLGKKGEEGDIG